MWFGLAAIALVGAIVLLYFDRIQRQRTGHARQVWAKAQGYTYVSVEPALPATWRRGALAKLGYLSAVDVVSGIRKGEKFVLFDLEDSATLVAVRRQIGSDIDIDMRLKTAAPPKDHDLELLGAIGDRVVFATNPEIARHAVDQRMVAFIEMLSDSVQMLWSEGNWTLGMLSVGTSSREWEAAIDAVLRLSGLLHVLPPVSEPRFGNDGHDPGRPRPRGRLHPEDDPEHHVLHEDAGRRPGAPRMSKSVESADDGGPAGAGFAENDYDDRDYDDYDDRGFDDRADSGRREDPESEYPERDFDDDRAPLSPVIGEESPRRPSLAVVPDAKTRVRAEPDLDDEHLDAERAPRADEDDRPERPQGRPGGPFHPGFRPYQGPVPR
ncbi:hypothetical protein GCM10023318_09140 [Nocardia callitridis]|uniref:Cell division protein n=1 Tax=Nocardia callitridis TaxID=648753 RepID=A0ABP9JWN9_9NOCA